MAAIPVSRGMTNGTAFSAGDFAAKRALTPTLSLRERELSMQRSAPSPRQTKDQPAPAVEAAKPADRHGRDSDKP